VATRNTPSKAMAWARRAPLLPALIFVIALTQAPFIVTLVISFLNWNALYPNDIGFAGIDNFVSTFTNERLRTAVLVSVGLTLSVVLISVLLGLGAAILLDRRFAGRGIVRTLFITPFLLVPVATALMWKHLIVNPEYGLVNGILTVIFGKDAPQPDFLSTFPLGVIAVSLIWQWTPFMMLIILAGLQARPLDVLEAAQIDGASTWQIFRYMTIPYLRRYLELAALLGSLYVVQNFDTVSTMTAGSLGTANMPYVIYQGFFRAQDYGQAAASGVIIVFGTLFLATFILRRASSLLAEDN
jgi:sorbitol/mannitol transport system permease protein